MAVRQIDKELYLFRIQKACEIARLKGAIFNEAVVVAQGALESAWGTSGLAKNANNLFGIKAGKSWTGDVVTYTTWEEGKNGWYQTVARWRKYLSWNLCLVDYAELIRSLPWFKDALEYLNNANLFLKNILPEPNEPGWATDSHYTTKILSVAKEIEALGGPRWQ